MVDPEVVAERLRYINEYTNDLKQMRGLSKDEYIADIVTPSSSGSSRAVLAELSVRDRSTLGLSWRTPPVAFHFADVSRRYGSDEIPDTNR